MTFAFGYVRSAYIGRLVIARTGEIARDAGRGIGGVASLAHSFGYTLCIGHGYHSPLRASVNGLASQEGPEHAHRTSSPLPSPDSSQYYRHRRLVVVREATRFARSATCRGCGDWIRGQLSGHPWHRVIRSNHGVVQNAGATGG